MKWFFVGQNRGKIFPIYKFCSNKNVLSIVIIHDKKNESMRVFTVHNRLDSCDLVPSLVWKGKCNFAM